MTTKLTVYRIFLVLTIGGAINWGLVGLLDLDLVATIFGEFSKFTRLVYMLVGFSGVYILVNKLDTLKKLM